MNQEESERIGMNTAEYFALYNQIRDTVGDQNVALAILQEVAKDIRASQIRQEKQQRANGSASERQKAHLRRLGVEFSQGITREEASRLIDEAVEREG